MKIQEKINRRVKDCVEIEMQFDFNDNGSFIGKEEYNVDFNINHVEILCDSDTEWNEKITRMKAELLRRKRQLKLKEISDVQTK